MRQRKKINNEARLLLLGTCILFFTNQFSFSQKDTLWQVFNNIKINNCDCQKYPVFKNFFSQHDLIFNPNKNSLDYTNCYQFNDTILVGSYTIFEDYSDPRVFFIFDLKNLFIHLFGFCTLEDSFTIAEKRLQEVTIEDTSGLQHYQFILPHLEPQRYQLKYFFYEENKRYKKNIKCFDKNKIIECVSINKELSYYTVYEYFQLIDKFKNLFKNNSIEKITVGD